MTPTIDPLLAAVLNRTEAENTEKSDMLAVRFEGKQKDDLLSELGRIHGLTFTREIAEGKKQYGLYLSNGNGSKKPFGGTTELAAVILATLKRIK